MEQNKVSVCGLKDVYEVDDGIDRISALPDSVLCHVLSYLPTKYAIATSILSTRWKTLFPSILNVVDIDFDDSLTMAIDNEVEQVNSLLIRFCNRVFGFHLRDVKRINSFRLLLSDCISGISFTYITKWISSALHLNVKKLEVVLDYYHVQYDIPDIIFTCKTLEVVVLVGGWQLKTPPLVELPRLRVLQLVNEPLVYNQSISSSILKGCPELEELILNSLMISDSTLEISLPKLRRLEIKECNNNYDRGFGVVLDAPALECLLLDDYLALDYSVKYMDSIHHVQVNILVRPTESVSVKNVMKLFHKFSHVKLLTLSTSTMEILAKSRLPLPTFDNLIHVNLGVVHTPFLVELLNKMPKLEVLVLLKGVDGDLESDLQENSTACVSLNLKEIRISDSNRKCNAIKALKYFHKAGAELKKIVIGSSASNADQLCIKEELLAVKGCLETCEIVIVTDKMFSSKFCSL
ncbi:hypothetical protein LIER_30004 [Lithospermum erythrorhizon]|uniref:F-box domain-containing protein n=1 Tax=Lithospermum erythrorhizon TaxID=34254 RepID=A0AAV3RL52_LITER